MTAVEVAVFLGRSWPPPSSCPTAYLRPYLRNGQTSPATTTTSTSAPQVPRRPRGRIPDTRDGGEDERAGSTLIVQGHQVVARNLCSQEGSDLTPEPTSSREPGFNVRGIKRDVPRFATDTAGVDADIVTLSVIAVPCWSLTPKVLAFRQCRAFAVRSRSER
jgi:hypothetical protein